ncbi:maleate cis-trans isomerase family protein [Streptomyces fuscichromogenes]|uniref:Decarboxylase n=1 Tax=Streptomyces fuscichromogenes TaxID=1324013 RepID=A0A917X8M8_9ACTN|nr:decarboxylase [Streptomyces fuscichromogenes]GGM91201.1 decarboxylase [Streptomyces fuscichromogenes]
MTALGLLYPGHSAEDDYPRIEQLLGSDIRVDVVHTDMGEDAHRVDALRGTGAEERLAAGVAELRLAGSDAVVWASTGGSFVYGWEGAQRQVRALARAAGLPASSTSFGFVHAARELGVRRVAVGATYPDDVAALFADFLRAGGLEVTGVRSSGFVTATEAGTWGEEEVLTLARAADVSGAQAVLLPDTALHTAAHLSLLEKALSKPVLAAHQVTVWEGLRLADRRVNAPALGTLFTREPIIQA